MYRSSALSNRAPGGGACAAARHHLPASEIELCGVRDRIRLAMRLALHRQNMDRNFSWDGALLLAALLITAPNVLMAQTNQTDAAR